MTTPLIAALVLIALSVIGTLIALALERGDTRDKRDAIIRMGDEGPEHLGEWMDIVNAGSREDSP